MQTADAHIVATSQFTMQPDHMTNSVWVLTSRSLAGLGEAVHMAKQGGCEKIATTTYFALMTLCHNLHTTGMAQRCCVLAMHSLCVCRVRICCLIGSVDSPDLYIVQQ